MDKDPEDLTGLTDDERRKLGRAPDPVLPGQVVPKVTPPRPVAISFWVWLAASVVIVAGQIYTVLNKQAIIDDLTKRTRETGKQFDPAQLASGTTTLIWTLFVGGVVFAALLMLFAYKAREGTRSARTVLTGLAVLSVLFQLLFLQGLFADVSALLLVIALVLLYLPRVAEYFPKVGKKL
ncbi:MAG TPA: hypothetical protein VJX66_12065 [Amycolatopsis sp.]|nr:hypothetical protein [Amycolatopsis sp.]